MTHKKALFLVETTYNNVFLVGVCPKDVNLTKN